MFTRQLPLTLIAYNTLPPSTVLVITLKHDKQELQARIATTACDHLVSQMCSLPRLRTKRSTNADQGGSAFSTKIGTPSPHGVSKWRCAQGRWSQNIQSMCSLSLRRRPDYNSGVLQWTHHGECTRVTNQTHPHISFHSSPPGPNTSAVCEH